MTITGKSIPINGLSPVPRDQCSNGGQQQQLEQLHSMYSTFRATPGSGPSPQVAPHAPPPPPTKAPSLSNGMWWATVLSHFILHLQITLRNYLTKKSCWKVKVVFQGKSQGRIKQLFLFFSFGCKCFQSNPTCVQFLCFPFQMVQTTVQKVAILSQKFEFKKACVICCFSDFTRVKPKIHRKQERYKLYLACVHSGNK